MHAYHQNCAGLINHPENKSSSSYITLIKSINALNFLIKKKDEKMRKSTNEWIIDRQFLPQKTSSFNNNKAEPKIQTWHIKSQ